MVTVPADTPVTTPVELMVAIAVLLLLHIPPELVSNKLMVEPTQTVEGPVIGAIVVDTPVTVKVT